MDLGAQYDKIYRYCYFRLGNERLAEDLTQETFLRFLESSRCREAGRPLAYLYVIARNLCVDEYRRKRPLLTDDWERMEGGGFLVQDNFEEQSITRIALHAALAKLTEQERELLLLRFANGLSYGQLAQIYGESRFALMRRLKKIAGKLERGMSDEEEA